VSAERHAHNEIAKAADRLAAADLDDAERECLIDLCRSDDRLVDLIVAHQRLDNIPTAVGDFPPGRVHDHAREARGEVNEAIGRLVEVHQRLAREIVALARNIWADTDQAGGWGPIVDVYMAGYEDVTQIRAAGREELVADAGLHPDVAAEIVEAVEVVA
jgi:hypothetical protein